LVNIYKFNFLSFINLEGNLAITQIRQLTRSEKTVIKYKTLLTNKLVKNSNIPQKPISSIHNSWITLNNENDIQSINLKHKKLVVYSYSLSYNLLKEVISRLQVDIILTKDIKKSSLIIGLKKHIQQNQKLQKFSKQKNIPIYGVSRSSIYEIAKLIQFIML
jgi:hypothetical protein